MLIPVLACFPANWILAPLNLANLAAPTKHETRRNHTEFALAQIFTYLAEQPVLYLFILVGFGMAFGHLKIKGVGLGAAGVLFLAIVISAWAQSYGVELRVTAQIGTLGLALFAFAIGINSGASFFANVKSAIGPVLFTLLWFCLSAGAGYGIGKALGMDTSLIAGTYAGALTNTPALSAAGEASGNLGAATVGYAIAYLFGVVGMLAAATLALAYSKSDTDKPSPLDNCTIRVEREDHPILREVAEQVGGHVSFSRLRRGDYGPIKRPRLTDVLYPGDLLTVVGTKEILVKIAKELGHISSVSLLSDRSDVDSRRLIVSNSRLAGLKLADLHLGQKYGASISRLQRGDVDMIAEPDTVLQLGDRVRVVAPADRLQEIVRFFGNSTRGMSYINPMALGIGMTLGILLGEIAIPLPGGSTFSIGAAAGTLIIGLIFGRVGRIKSVVTTLPNSACQVLSEFGLLIFLAQAGANAGGQIIEAFTSGSWWKIFVVGVVMTGILAIGLFLSMRLVVKMGGTRLSGLLAGAQTQPAVLAFANSRTSMDPRVALGYAMVYPVAMVGKILVAQVLGGLP